MKLRSAGTEKPANIFIEKGFHIMTIERVRKANSVQMSEDRKRQLREQFKRKHFTMMTESEKAVLKTKLRRCNTRKVELTSHWRKRQHDYSVYFTIDEMLAAIHTGTVIDYMRDRKNRQIERFLIRDMNGSQHRVIVLHHEFGRWIALTGWVNAADDMHETLDMSIYEDFSIHDCVD